MVHHHGCAPGGVEQPGAKWAGAGIGKESRRVRGKAEGNLLVGRVATSWCEKWCGSGLAIQGEAGLAVRVLGKTLSPKNASGERGGGEARERKDSWLAEGIPYERRRASGEELVREGHMVPDSPAGDERERS